MIPVEPNDGYGIRAVITLAEDILRKQDPRFVPLSAREFLDTLKTRIRREMPGMLAEDTKPAA